MMQRLTCCSLLALCLLLTACGGGGGGKTDSDSTRVDSVARPQATLDLPFQIVVQPAAQQPQGMPGLQSAAFAEAGGQWLFVGGRVNGFHGMFGPSRQFPQSLANDKLWVIDPGAGKTYGMAIPTSWPLRDNLMANNMCFTQVGDILYFVGGYGSQSATGPSNYTFNTLIAIQVSEMIAAVVADNADEAAAALLYTIENDAFQVTGGELEAIGDDFYLAFGQDYPRAYDGQNGTYTESIVHFQVNGGATPPTAAILGTATYAGGSPNQFHRRDLNALHGFDGGGNEVVIAWSGVFTDQQGAWPHPILITPGGATPATNVETQFTQKANLYKSASVVMYDSQTGALYTSMLGGITNYFLDPATDSIVPSDTLPITMQLPFSNLINTIVRTPDGNYMEYIQRPPNILPGYLGANAQFVPVGSLVHTHEVLDYAKVSAQPSTLVGWMVGGIESSGMQSGNGVTTKASNVLYEVHVKMGGS